MTTRQIVIEELITEWMNYQKDVDLALDNVKDNVDRFTQRLFQLQREEEQRLAPKLENQFELTEK